MGVAVPPLTWSAFYELYTDVRWGVRAYGWTVVEEQVEYVDEAGHSTLLVIMTQGFSEARWGVWCEWTPALGVGVNGVFGGAVPADTMMQVVPVRPVPATRWEVVA